jgi:hypothetical protein
VYYYMVVNKKNVVETVAAPQKKSNLSKAAEKKKQSILNKAKANPALAAENKASADAKRLRRKESGSTKQLGN